MGGTAVAEDVKFRVTVHPRACRLSAFPSQGSAGGGHRSSYAFRGPRQQLLNRGN